MERFEVNTAGMRDGAGYYFDSDGLSYTQRVLIAVAIVTLVVVFLWMVNQVVEVFLIVFAGILVAVLLRGLADLLSDYTPIPTRWAVGVVILLLLALSAAVAWFAGPRVADEADRLLREAPQALGRLEDRIEQYEWGRRILERAPATATGAAGGREGIFSSLTGIVSTALGAIANLVLILAIGFYLAVDPNPYHAGILHLVPPSKRERADEVLHTLRYNLWQFLKGRGIAILIDSAVTAVGLWIIGMPLIFVLVAIEAVMILVPFIGPLLAAIPALLIASTISTRTVIYVALLYAAVEFFETYIVTPLVQKYEVELPPALILASAVILALLFGALGVLLAVPLLTVVVVLVKMLYVQDTLGDESADVLGEDEAEKEVEEDKRAAAVGEGDLPLNSDG